MKRNVGSLDRTVRLVLGALLVVVGIVSYAGLIPLGPLPAALGAIVAVVFGLVLLVTGYRQSCLLYLPFGIDTSDRR